MTPHSTVILSDNMKYMPQFPDKYFQIAVPDPVYGIDGNSHRKNEGRGKATKAKAYHNALWYQEKPDDNFFVELQRVSENQIIFGANYFPYICGTEFKTPRRNEYDQFIKDHPTNWIIWDKVNYTLSFNDCELIWVSFPVSTQIFYFMWNGMMQGKSFKEGATMQGDKKKNQKRCHPTEKPFEVYKYLFHTFAKKGDKILDPNSGGQSSRVVAFQMGFDYWGCEIDETYFNDGNNRFAQECLGIYEYNNGIKCKQLKLY